MMIQAIAFYSFAGILVLAALMVISARNPVHSVLFLILAFFNAAGLFVMLGAEFLAFILVIVYVGAVAVLFLFVVMMLNVDFANLRKGAMQYVPLGLLLGGVLLAELFMLYTAYPQTAGTILETADAAAPFSGSTNTEMLGQILYTRYIFAFQMAGLVLFVAMVGAIVLTHRVRPGVRRQNIARQHDIKPEDVLEMRKVNTGSGA